VNTARGLIGEDTSALIGSTLINLVGLRVAAQAGLPEHRRRRVTAIVDEFHALPGANYELLPSEPASARWIRPRRRARQTVPSPRDGGVVGDPFEEPCDPTSRAERLGRLALCLAPADRRLLDEIGPHAYTAEADLAAVVGWGERRLRERISRLVEAGLVRFEHRQLEPTRALVTLPELTWDGMAIAAAQIGLTLGEAVRFCGHVAARPGAPPSPRPGQPGHARAELLAASGSIVQSGVPPASRVAALPVAKPRPKRAQRSAS
jgi:hypothetical protein